MFFSDDAQRRLHEIANTVALTNDETQSNGTHLSVGNNPPIDIAGDMKSPGPEEHPLREKDSIADVIVVSAVYVCAENSKAPDSCKSIEETDDKAFDSFTVIDEIENIDSDNGSAIEGATGNAVKASETVSAMGIDLFLQRDSAPPVQAPVKIDIGTILENRYQLVEKIGQGGTATVYKARHLSLGNLWAVKVFSESEPTLQDHLKETEILKHLSHPMLPRIADVLHVKGYVLVVMDYLSGENLLEKLKKQQNFSENIVKYWMVQLCDVLHYLHTRGNGPIIYRDLKPSNLLLDAEGQLKLVDFGTARTYQAGREGDTSYIGTQGYAAPEQFGLFQSDARTDIYNLGMTASHLLTGVHPVSIAQGSLSDVLLQHAISEQMVNVLLQCTALLPSKRFQDALACKAALETTPLERLPNQEKQGEPIEPGDAYTVKGQLRLSLLGVCPGVGVTHQSVALAAYFAKLKRHVSYVEMNASGDMFSLRQRLQSTGHVKNSGSEKGMHLPMSNRMSGTEGVSSGRRLANGTSTNLDDVFTFQKINFHPACQKLTDLRTRQYDITVTDIGSKPNGHAMEEFFRSDVQLVICPQADWKLDRIATFFDRFDPHGAETQMVYAMVEATDLNAHSLQPIFGKRQVLFFPWIENPFELSKTEMKKVSRFLQQLGVTLN